MKYSFIVLMLLPFAEIRAQDCKFEKNEVDNFTHTKTVQTTPVMICSKTEPVSGEGIHGKKVTIAVSNIQNNYLIYLGLQYNNNSSFFLSPKKDCLIILENDSIVSITGIFEGFNNGLKGNNFTQKFSFILSYETVLLLEKYKVKEIRLIDSELNEKVDIKFNTGKEDSIRKELQCIRFAMFDNK